MFKPLRNLVLVKRHKMPGMEGLIALPEERVEQSYWVTILEVNDGVEKPCPFKVGQVGFLRQWSGCAIDTHCSKWESRILVPQEMIEAFQEEV